MRLICQIGVKRKVETDNMGPEKNDTKLKHVFYDHPEHEIQSVNISETEPSEYTIWLVGSSIVRDLKPKLIYKYKKNKSYHIKRQNNIRSHRVSETRKDKYKCHCLPSWI